MKTSILYFTGTGNSLWLARKIGERLEGCTVLSMVGLNELNIFKESDVIGLVFPVYVWGVPAPVLEAVNKLSGCTSSYFFAVASNGGQVANTLVQLKKVMKHSGLKLHTGLQIRMPSNYIPWGGPEDVNEQRKMFSTAEKKIEALVDTIRGKTSGTIERGTIWQRLLSATVYPLLFPLVKKMDSKFYADDKCNACGICSKVCPSLNITYHNKRPVWNHKCEQCFACLQWCPKKAIQYGKKTVQYERYHHPEVKLADIVGATSNV